MAVQRWGGILVDVRGEGAPLVVLPGGPGRHPDYLEGLGGLDRRGYRLIAVLPPAAVAGHRSPDGRGLSASHQVDSLEAVRRHLDAVAITVVAHSAGAAVAFNYAMRFPQRLKRLVLVTPATQTVGLVGSQEELAGQMAKRREQPWYDSAVRAMRDMRDYGANAERRHQLMPLIYGSWSERVQEHAALEREQSRAEVARFYSSDEPDPREVRAAMGRVTCPVRILVGEVDPRPGPRLAQDLASLFPDARVSVVAGAGHFPWVTQPLAFASLLGEALTA